LEGQPPRCDGQSLQGNQQLPNGARSIDLTCRCSGRQSVNLTPTALLQHGK
jgi:hypothetical protein